jgi:hypothetical protein
MNASELLRYLLNMRVIVGALIIALILFCLTSALLWFTRPETINPGQSTAVLNVISVPTATEVEGTPTPEFDQTPSASALPSPPPGEIAIGAYVQVSGTGGDGLRLRAEPGLDGEVRFLGLEAEVFLVEAGPEQVDDYTWWYMVAPYDDSVNGWGVSNFLVVVQNP